MKTNYQLAIDGEIEPSLAYVELLAQQEEIAEKLAQLKPLVLQELQAYPEKEVKLHGLTFQKKSAAGRWDYSDRKSTRLNSSHSQQSRMPSSA